MYKKFHVVAAGCFAFFSISSVILKFLDFEVVSIVFVLVSLVFLVFIFMKIKGHLAKIFHFE